MFSALTSVKARADLTISELAELLGRSCSAAGRFDRDQRLGLGDPFKRRQSQLVMKVASGRATSERRAVKFRVFFRPCGERGASTITEK